MAVTEVAGIGHGVGFKPVKDDAPSAELAFTTPIKISDEDADLLLDTIAARVEAKERSRPINPAPVAQHHSAGKPRLLLVPPRAKACVARVMEFGESKGYMPGPDGTPNYLLPGKLDTVESDTSWLESAERHITALAAGETIDPESGLPHLDHLAANAMIVIERREYRKGVYRK